MIRHVVLGHVTEHVAPNDGSIVVVEFVDELPE